jgi:hypothetical protein
MTARISRAPLVVDPQTCDLLEIISARQRQLALIYASKPIALRVWTDPALSVAALSYYYALA